MAAKEGSPKYVHPEGLTKDQEILADMLFETKQMAPVTRRFGEPGNYRFEKNERLTSPIDFAQEGEFALKLHEKDPDALLSPIYVNLRNLPESLVDQVGLVLSEIPTDEPVDFYTGIPNAGTPLAKAYVKHSGIPYMDIYEKEVTGDGRRIVSEGNVTAIQGKKVRLIDDLATGGDTKLEAIRAAEELGARVVDILVLVDRQQGATEQLKEAGYTLKAAFTLDQLLRYGVRTGNLTQEQYVNVRSYLDAQSSN